MSCVDSKQKTPSPGGPFIQGELVRCIDAAHTDLVQGQTYYVELVETDDRNPTATVRLRGKRNAYIANRFVAAWMEKGFVKFDGSKPRPSLIPPNALAQVLDVLEHGAKKYSADNWRKCEDWTRYYDAAMRHLMAWRVGERHDPDTGLDHLAHACCSLMFLLEAGEYPFEGEGR
jgi:hypothetical protein